MYKPNRIGTPCHPVIDLDSQTTDAAAITTAAYNAALNVYLSSSNVGSNTEGFMTYYKTTNAITIPTITHHSVGMVLKPLSSIKAGIDNLLIEFTGSCDHTGPGSTALLWKSYIPFIGVIDSALTPAAGYDATNNAVSKYNLLPCERHSSGSSWNTCIVLKDVVSSFDRDDYICLGAVFRNVAASTASLDYPYITMSARYNLRPIPLTERA